MLVVPGKMVSSFIIDSTLGIYALFVAFECKSKVYTFKFLKFLCVCTYVFMCMYIYYMHVVPAEVKTDIGPSETGVTDSCETPDVDAESQPQAGPLQEQQVS